MSDNNFRIKRVDLSQIRYEPMDGEVAFDTTTERVMIYHDGAWQAVTTEGAGLNLGLYDINKQIIAQLPDLEDWTDKTILLNNFHAKWNNQFYMLYGKEISYFTLFKINRVIEFMMTLSECLANIGPIKAFDLTEAEDAIEIWAMSNGEPTCLYLFPYDSGLVEVGE